MVSVVGNTISPARFNGYIKLVINLSACNLNSRMSHGYSPSETDTFSYLGSQARKNKGTINGYINEKDRFYPKEYFFIVLTQVQHLSLKMVCCIYTALFKMVSYLGFHLLQLYKYSPFIAVLFGKFNP